MNEILPSLFLLPPSFHSFGLVSIITLTRVIVARILIDSIQLLAWVDATEL